jgi:hypothetical protein
LACHAYSVFNVLTNRGQKKKGLAIARPFLGCLAVKALASKQTSTWPGFARSGTHRRVALCVLHARRMGRPPLSRFLSRTSWRAQTYS